MEAKFQQKLKYLYELSLGIYEMFKAQDPDTGKLDVVFEFDGKKLYAHKSKLCEHSDFFKVMFCQRWTTPNEPITTCKIEKYSFDDFKEFITFLYSGDIDFTHDNIIPLADMAEYYNVPVFKKACQEFLLKIVWDLKNVFQMLDLADKYRLKELKKSLHDFISKNLPGFLKCVECQSLQKSINYDIVKSNQNTVRQEELFEMVISLLYLKTNFILYILGI
uniref:BTB domain-containing protein n=1 Tax=Panagrolaimus sp. ES5 TaxID=591445 RepID=A0AC34F9Z7_9BILA